MYGYCQILHQNSTDFWIVSRLENSNTYHAYLLTSSGLNTVPVVTNIGAVLNGTGGYLRGSPIKEKAVRRLKQTSRSKILKTYLG